MTDEYKETVYGSKISHWFVAFAIWLLSIITVTLGWYAGRISVPNVTNIDRPFVNRMAKITPEEEKILRDMNKVDKKSKKRRK